MKENWIGSILQLKWHIVYSDKFSSNTRHHIVLSLTSFKSNSSPSLEIALKRELCVKNLVEMFFNSYQCEYFCYQQFKIWETHSLVRFMPFSSSNLSLLTACLQELDIFLQLLSGSHWHLQTWSSTRYTSNCLQCWIWKQCVGVYCRPVCPYSSSYNLLSIPGVAVLLQHPGAVGGVVG